MTSGDCGVCLSGGFGDGQPTVFRERTRKARKLHRCCERGREILPGQRYSYVAGLWEDRWTTFETCLDCDEIRKAFGCEGFIYLTLWDDMKESVFPQMTTGCLDRLKTASAKGYLLDRWRAWKFDTPF